MKRYTYTNTMPFTFDPNHRGAHYLIGGKYKNHGEWLESVAKYHRGLEYLVNPATSYDEGSDIESLNASVKSAGCSLACVYGPTYEAIKETYFANVHSTLWIYMQDFGEEIVEWHMNREEFEAFLDEFHEMAKESGSGLQKVRTKKNLKVIKWLEERVA